MVGEYVITTFIVVGGLFVLVRGLVIIRPHERGVVERLGKYNRTLGSGLSLVLPFVDEITRSPALTDPVSKLLGEDLLVFGCSLFTKEANSTSYVSWHQDLHYWGLENEEQVTAWLALSPATVESGCMRFVAGSHHQILEHQDTFADDNLLTRGQEIAVDVDDSDAVDGSRDLDQRGVHLGAVGARMGEENEDPPHGASRVLVVTFMAGGPERCGSGACRSGGARMPR